MSRIIRIVPASRVMRQQEKQRQEHAAAHAASCPHGAAGCRSGSDCMTPGWCRTHRPTLITMLWLVGTATAITLVSMLPQGVLRKLRGD